MIEIYLEKKGINCALSLSRLGSSLSSFSIGQGHEKNKNWQNWNVAGEEKVI